MTNDHSPTFDISLRLHPNAIPFYLYKYKNVGERVHRRLATIDLLSAGILMQQQEKLKQKIREEQEQRQQQHCQPTQHPMVPLTPESVARFLANQSQSEPIDPHPWPIHHSISAPSFLPFTDDYFDICPSVTCVDHLAVPSFSSRLESHRTKTRRRRYSSQSPGRFHR